MTLLEAVNLCLRSIGESGVLTYATSHPKFANILAEIDTQSKREQAKQWWFNTGIRTLTSDVASPYYIHLPDGTTPAGVPKYVAFKPAYAYQNYYPQGGILVNGDDGTTVAGTASAALSVKGQARWEYQTTDADWLNLPGTFTDMVANKAALSFASNYDADPLQMNKLRAQLSDSLIAVKADDIRYKRVNMFQAGEAGSKITRAYGSRYWVR